MGKAGVVNFESTMLLRCAARAGQAGIDARQCLEAQVAGSASAARKQQRPYELERRGYLQRLPGGALAGWRITAKGLAAVGGPLAEAALAELEAEATAAGPANTVT